MFASKVANICSNRFYINDSLLRSQCLHGVFGGGAEAADADRQDGDKQYCQ